MSFNISESCLEVYNLYCNDLTQNTRGVIIYVDNVLTSSEINFEVSFNENIFVRINSDTVIGNIYRSPSSTDENDSKLYELVDTLSKSVIILYWLETLILVIFNGVTGPRLLIHQAVSSLLTRCKQNYLCNS